MAVAVMGVLGVVAVLACGPSTAAVPGQSGTTGAVQESVSVPATGAPFVLQQSGDGGGGQGEPTTEPTTEPTASPTEEPTPTQYVPPTADPSECKGSGDHRRCPPDGDPKVEYRVRQYYNRAMRQNETIGLRGDDREFPELKIHITAETSADVDGVVEFLRDNGVRLNQWSASVNPDTDFGMVSVSMDLSLLPELVALEGVARVREDLLETDVTPGWGFGSNAVDQELWALLDSLISENRDRRGRGDEELSYPVIRVLIEARAASAVGEVVRHLSSNDARKIVWKRVEPSEADADGGGTVEADISMSLEVLSGLMWFPGVERVSLAMTTSRRDADAGEPVSGRNEGRGTVLPPFEPADTPASATSSVDVVLQADQWHRAGFTGAGVLRFRGGGLLVRLG